MVDVTCVVSRGIDSLGALLRGASRSGSEAIRTYRAITYSSAQLYRLPCEPIYRAYIAHNLGTHLGRIACAPKEPYRAARGARCRHAIGLLHESLGHKREIWLNYYVRMQEAHLGGTTLGPF